MVIYDCSVFQYINYTKMLFAIRVWKAVADHPSNMRLYHHCSFSPAGSLSFYHYLHPLAERHISVYQCCSRRTCRHMYTIICGQPSYQRHINLYLSRVEKITSVPLALRGVGVDCGDDNGCRKTSRGMYWWNTLKGCSRLVCWRQINHSLFEMLKSLHQKSDSAALTC